MADRATAPLPSLRRMLASVHLRLVAFAVMLVSLLLLASGVAVIHGYAERNLFLVARTISYSVEPAVVFGDVEAVRESMISVAGINDVDAIEVVGADGRMLAQWRRPAAGPLASLQQWANGMFWRSPMIDDVRRGGRVLAQVRVHGGVSGMGIYLLSGVAVAVWCLGLAILATHMLSRRLQESVIAPLAQVAQVTHEVRTQRAFDRRLPSSGIAEIDHFSQDFNALLAELEGWHVNMTKENQALAVRASHDDLTGLGNRALFERTLEATVSEAVRTGASCAVLYLDANRFKEINDTHGHAAGDVILRTIGQRLRACIRQIDHAFRLGGDEFAIILAPSVGREDAERIVSRIAQAMEEPVTLPDGTPLVASLSIGFAIYPDDGMAASDLLSRADAAMYHDKRRRRRTDA